MNANSDQTSATAKAAKTLPIPDHKATSALLRFSRKHILKKKHLCEANQVSAAFEKLAKMAELNNEQLYLLLPFISNATQWAYGNGYSAGLRKSSSL